MLLVSGADKLHNARAILGDLREHGDELWMRFNRGASEQLWYYGALRDVFLRRLPGRLADELDETVRAIERQIDPEDPREPAGGGRLAPLVIGQLRETGLARPAHHRLRRTPGTRTMAVTP